MDRPDFHDLTWWHHHHPPPRKRARVRGDELVEVWLHPDPLASMTLCVYQGGRWRKVGWAPNFQVLEELYAEIDNPVFKQDITRFFPAPERQAVMF